MIIYIVHNLDTQEQEAFTDGIMAGDAAQALEAEGIRIKVFRHRIETDSKKTKTKPQTEAPKAEVKPQTVTATPKQTTSKKKKTEGKKDFMDRWLDFYKRSSSQSGR